MTCPFLQNCHLQRSVEAQSVEGLLLCRSWKSKVYELHGPGKYFLHSLASFSTDCIFQQQTAWDQPVNEEMQG